MRGQGVEEAGAGLREVGVRPEPEAGGEERPRVKLGAGHQGVRQLAEAGPRGRESGCWEYDSYSERERVNFEVFRHFAIRLYFKVLKRIEL